MLSAQVLKAGDRLKDNRDPHIKTFRTLSVVSVTADSAGVVTAVQARQHSAARLVTIGAKSIHPQDSTRRTGFTILARPPVDERIVALLGQPITLHRGSRSRTSGPGCNRFVSARLDRVEGIMVFATLLQDDPMAGTAPYKSGESGMWHGLSFVKELA